MPRSLLPHCEDQEAKIDGFACTQCAWSYRIENPKPAYVDEQDARRACLSFEGHDCKQFPVVARFTTAA